MKTLVGLFELLITVFKADLASCLSFCVWLIKIWTLVKDPDGSSPWGTVHTSVPVTPIRLLFSLKDCNMDTLGLDLPINIQCGSGTGVRRICLHLWGISEVGSRGKEKGKYSHCIFFSNNRAKNIFFLLLLQIEAWKYKSKSSLKSWTTVALSRFCSKKKFKLFQVAFVPAKNKSSQISFFISLHILSGRREIAHRSQHAGLRTDSAVLFEPPPGTTHCCRTSFP